MKFFVPILSLILIACSPGPKSYDAQEVVDEAISAHKADYLNKTVSFDFRDVRYSVTRKKHGYVYTREWQDDSLGYIKDVLINSSRLTRLIDGDTVDLDEEWSKKYTSSVNSVLYFFQIPLVLNDGGAIKKYVGEFDLKGSKYLGIRVTFSEDGGGEDHEDVFIYWIHAEKKTVDFLAYSYLTEGGGVRFREAINRREFKGLIVQDYVNYKADKGTPLESLPALFEEGKLEELSIIANERVKVEKAAN